MAHMYMLIFLLKNMSSFCICKSYSHFFSKNIYELDTVLTRKVNILIMMLQTTGPLPLPKVVPLTNDFIAPT